MNSEVIGWVSSMILVCTIGQQVWQQWREGSTKGISRWLFLGQLVASAGFAIYSLAKKDWVFVCTNLLMLVNALLGYLILRRNRRRCAAGAPAS